MVRNCGEEVRILFAGQYLSRFTPQKGWAVSRTSGVRRREIEQWQIIEKQGEADGTDANRCMVTYVSDSQGWRSIVVILYMSRVGAASGNGYNQNKYRAKTGKCKILPGSGI
jgi:hypothetical protein